jgi:hypothetical protein
MSVGPRKLTLVTPLFLIGAGALAAQSPAAPTTPAPASSRCLVGSTALRTATGGVLGAWIGLVAHKIAVSDWNDVSHTAEGHRALNRSMITGAVVGGVIGSLIHVGNPCAGGMPYTQKARVGREPLFASEIDRAGVTGTVYDALFTLRRNWLNTRGIQALTEGAETLVLSAKDTITLQGSPRLTVYLDNAKLGTVDELRTLPIMGVTSVRYFEPAEATMRWGAGNTHGAIQVLTSEP